MAYDKESPAEDKNETPAQEMAEGDVKEAKKMMKKAASKKNKSAEELAASVLKKKSQA